MNDTVTPLTTAGVFVWMGHRQCGQQTELAICIIIAIGGTVVPIIIPLGVQ